MTIADKLKELREEAEKAMKEMKRGDNAPGEFNDNFQKLLHELQVHQIELEMQNEELQRVQALLEMEKNRYTDLFEYSPVSYLLFDKQGLIVSANQTFCTIMNQSKTDIIGKTLQSFIAPGSQDTFHIYLGDMTEQGKSSPFNIQLKHSERTDLWFRVESKIFYSKDTKEYIIQASLTDVSVNKQNEEELLRLSAAFEQSANSIMITDIKGKIQYANPQFYSTSGYSQEEIIGQNPRLLKHENSSIDYKQMWENITSGKTWKGEFLNKNKFGKAYWEIVTITPVKNFEGKIINFLAIKEDITQRKSAEQNLQKAKDFYLKLLEDFPVMVWRCDEEGEFNFFNKTFADFSGVNSKNPSTHLYINLIHEKDREIFLDSFRRSLKTRSSFVVEYRLKDRFGNYRWVLNHGRPFTNMENKHGGFIATCTDIHDRRIIEERLIDSEDRYRRMFEDSSLGIFRLDRSFKFVSANKAFATMFGYDNTVDFLIDINNNPKKFFPEYGKEKDFRKQLVKSKNNRFMIEKELYRKDKSKIHTLIHLRKVYERSRDKLFYMEGFIEDVTNRKQAEKKLLFSEQKFKALFEKSYDAILILRQGKAVDYNRRASELFEKECNELIDINFIDLSASLQYNNEPALPLLRKKMSQSLQGEPQHFEWLLLRNGKTFDAEVSFSRIYMKTQYMIQAIVRDISEKKQVEKELKQARDEAERARQAQSDFLSLMSHEIRTPLNAVISLTDLMLHEKQDDDQKENLQSVKISASHLLGLIDDILDYNKIESGNIQFEIEDFNIRKLIEELRKVLEIKTQEKGIRLITNIDNKVPEILRGDTLRLKQILFNMLSNATKFTSKGYVSLRVELQEGNTDKVFFEVKDTGIGISENRLEAIFEKFTQEHKSTTRKYGGSGLGLSISKRLVELQKGRIYAQSKKGEGSVFSFYIPMTKGKMKPSRSKKASSGKPGHYLKGMSILMVEDDPMNQFVGKKVIERKWLAELVIASSAEEAIELLKTHTFDLILLDLLLPKMDGYELAKSIRSKAIAEIIQTDIPIIALTADAFVETRQKAFDSGMNDFITKPFDYESLFQKLYQFKPSASK